MGKRGPAPSPSAIRKARGGPDRTNPIKEPEPVLGEPDRPVALTSEAAKVWDAVVPLVGAGVLSRDNGQSLARYCHGVVRWWKLAAWLDVNEDVYSTKDKGGNVRWVRHPHVITYEKLGRDLTRMEQEFGLTPSSRTRVHALTTAPPTAKPKPAGPPVMRIASA